MTQGKVEICGVNTAKLPLLKAEEKEKLFQQIEQGDTDARQQYIEGNLRLVLSVIKRFAASNENVDDLFQIGSPAPMDLQPRHLPRSPQFLVSLL